jgi:hypothetical protein
MLNVAASTGSAAGIAARLRAAAHLIQNGGSEPNLGEFEGVSTLNMRLTEHHDGELHQPSEEQTRTVCRVSLDRRNCEDMPRKRYKF